jgi:glycosyltransferase involved in cell wall biosynthesis
LNLILFTVSYPYDAGAEQTFIGRELPFLCRHFERIVLVPRQAEGSRISIPQGVEVEEGFAALLKEKSLIGVAKEAVRSRLFYRDILSRPEILIHITMLARLLRFVGEAELLKKWLQSWIQDEKVDVRNSLFYTFWFDQLAMGVGLAKDHFPELNLVSRAHGYDVYEERYHPPYWPCRRQALKNVDKLFLASDDARDYLLNRYPHYSPLFETAHLGVQDPGFVASPSKDGIFRIVSCSSLVALKRIDLLIRGIRHAAELRPEQGFEWRHFGDGPIRRKLLEMLKDLPPNVQGSLDGYLPNEQILAYYRRNPVDVIVNVSESEGGSPVSIMEALSCGIPAIATTVGGNPEIVSQRNGILLSADPSPAEIAQALFILMDDPDELERKREASRAVWHEKYNDARNFDAFANRLKAIMGVFL